MKAKTYFLLLFSLFLYEKDPEPVKKKYLKPEPVKKGPAPQHWRLPISLSRRKTMMVKERMTVSRDSRLDA